jgi:hypothetical protein
MNQKWDKFIAGMNPEEDFAIFFTNEGGLSHWIPDKKLDSEDPRYKDQTKTIMIWHRLLSRTGEYWDQLAPLFHRVMTDMEKESQHTIH